MQITFTKMHGLGNDFVVIDAISQTIDLSPEQVRLIADRHRGVGCDQLLLVERPRSPDVDFRYRIFNADGSEVGHCGNGARCFARFVVDHGLTDKREIAVETFSNGIQLRIEVDGQVTVNMGAPHFEPADIPFEAETCAAKYALALEETSLEIGVVSMGNPHAVIRVDDVNTAAVAEWGPRVEGHPRFPERTNVGFMQPVSRRQIRLRVFERGSGETRACGTGACAAAVVAHLWGLVDDEVAVDLPGGRLLIRWAGGDAPVFMTGPAETVFEGSITL
ncbi:MAG TPA: diaminopimelate epimerase [Chromatiales bacterium]|nr:diaminopimelate epimerase [Chromatiales bacterium]HEX23178.1 diaminopimelate epimerase [Chromatiales bacterium]